MKVLVTGITGRCGGEVLRQCLRHPGITSVLALARRPLNPPITDPKLNVIIVKDFLNYPDDVKAQLRTVDAAVWALGKPTFPNLEEAKKVTIDYTTTAMSTLTAGRKDSDPPLRFVFVSGAAVERDQEKPLWFLQDARRVKGLGETAVLDFGKQTPSIECYIARPAWIAPGAGIVGTIQTTLIGWSVHVTALAAALIDVALNGSGDSFIQNKELNSRGSKSLKAVD